MAKVAANVSLHPVSACHIELGIPNVAVLRFGGMLPRTPRGSRHGLRRSDVKSADYPGQIVKVKPPSGVRVVPVM
jgi:hypothetical protein